MDPTNVEEGKMDISTGMYSAISGRRVEPDYVQGLEPLRRGVRIAERLKSAENRDTSRSRPREPSRRAVDLGRSRARC